MKTTFVAPLFCAPSYLSIACPIRLDSSVRIDTMPGWVTADSILRELSPDHKEMLEDETEYAVIAEFDAKSTAGGELTAADAHTRAERPPKEKLTLATLALWLAKRSAVRCELILTAEVRSDTDFTWREISTVEPIHPHKQYLNQELTDVHLVSATRIFQGIMSIKQPSSLWVAVYSLFAALTIRTWEARFLMLWTGMEALFGCIDSREITYRLSNRLGFFLAHDRQEARVLCSQAKKCYGWRSKTIHGMHLAKLKPDKSEELLYWSEMKIAQCIVKIVSDSQLMDVFSTKQREQYLDEQIYS